MFGGTLMLETESVDVPGNAAFVDSSSEQNSVQVAAREASNGTARIPPLSVRSYFSLSGPNGNLDRPNWRYFPSTSCLICMSTRM